MNESMRSGTVSITGHGGDAVEAYRSLPDGRTARGGVVVIHHLPGYDRATKEIVRRFSEMGYNAICPNLYSREAPGATPDAASAVVRASGGVPDEQLIGDVAGSADSLRELPTSNGKVAVIGYCSGGRQAVLAACAVPLDAAVDCYGAWVTGTPPQDWPIVVTSIADRLPALGCPLLGLFGAEDSYPAPRDVLALDEILTAQDKEHEFHTFSGAGHAFFATDRPSYRVDAANRGWELIRDFFARTLGH